MKQQFFVGDIVKITGTPVPVQGAVWTSTMDDCYGRTGTIVDVVEYNSGCIGYLVNVSFEHYNFAPEWLTIVERAWQKNTGEQPVDGSVHTLYASGAQGYGAARMMDWEIKDEEDHIISWRLPDSPLSEEEKTSRRRRAETAQNLYKQLFPEEQPEGIPPSHVALGDSLVQVGEPHMKIWCDTCQGTGEIDETLGGESFSSRDTPCPDCDGKGWWERVIAASADNAPVLQDKKHSHYFKKCGYNYVDVYRILKMFDVTDPCISHACKKLLVTGGRGFKDIDHDIQDVIDTLVRWQEMRKEDDEQAQ